MARKCLIHTAYRGERVCPDPRLKGLRVLYAPGHVGMPDWEGEIVSATHKCLTVSPKERIHGIMISREKLSGKPIRLCGEALDPITIPYTQDQLKDMFPSIKTSKLKKND